MESRALALALAICLLAGVTGQVPRVAPAPSTQSTASAPSPQEASTITTLVGPGPYAVQSTVDALAQTPRKIFLCADDGLFGIDTTHVAVSNATFPGPASLQSNRWNAERLILYCTSSTSQYPVETGDLPTVNGAQSTRIVDADSFDGYSTGASRPSTAETIYSVTPTSSLFLHNIQPSRRSRPTSVYYRPDAAYTNLTCTPNHKFVGVRWAASYGGIDDLQFICAPNSWAPTAGTPVNVDGASVPVGSIYTLPTVSTATPALPAGTCSNANLASQHHIGPGNSYESLRTNFTGTTITAQPVTTLLCDGNSYITQWNLRGQQWPASYTGERVAYIGAQCSNGRKLAAAPTGNLSGTANGPLGPDKYFTAGGQSGTNDANGWNAFYIQLDGPSSPFGFPEILGTLDSAGSTVGQYQDASDQVAVCPPAQRAVGYTVGAYNGGGITSFDLVCAPNCTLAGAPGPSSGSVAPGPTSAQPGQTQPGQTTPPSSPEKTLYGCGSTMQVHIGPGQYALYNPKVLLPPGQQLYSTHVCPAGSYIGTWRASVSSFDSPTKSEYDTYVTSISATCIRRNSATLYQLTPVEAGRATNETEYTFTEQAGWSTFEITKGTADQLQQFIDIDDTPATNYTLRCPAGWVAIGYEIAAYDFGIDYFDIICGPKLPEDCPDNSGGGGSIPSGNNGGGRPGASIPPPSYPYTTNPNGPSWGSEAPVVRPNTPSGSATPPPPPNSPGNSIDLTKLSPRQTFLRVTLGVTGSNINPFPKNLQDDYNKTLATITKVPQRNVTYVSATLNSTSSSGRRHLLAEQAGRSLLQATETMDVQYSIQFASARALAEAAQELVQSLTPPNTTFATVLNHPELSTTFKNISASDQQASTQAASTNCPRKFGSICNNSSLSTGGIIGIIIGGIVFLALVAALAAFLISRRRTHTNMS